MLEACVWEVSAGAVTHSFNMSQRGIELVISGIGAGTVDVEEPPQVNLAPPGWYCSSFLMPAAYRRSDDGTANAMIMIRYKI